MTSIFVNPFFLWGALLVSVPIIIHLLNRRRYKKINWAAMEFLLLAFKKTRRKMRLESLLILLIRMLILTLLAIALARPFVGKKSLASLFTGQGRRVYLLIDTSCSMKTFSGGVTLIEKAKTYSRDLVEGMSYNDRTALYILDDQLNEIIPEPTTDKGELIEQIRVIKPRDGSCNLSGGLRSLGEFLKKRKLSGELIFLTDLQARNWENQGLSGDISNQLKSMQDQLESLTIVDLGLEVDSNVGISSLESIEPIIGKGIRSPWRIIVSNYGSDNVEGLTVQLSIDGQISQTSETFALDPNERKSVDLYLVFNSKGPHSVKATVNGNDSFLFDNSRYASVNIIDSIPVLLVDGDMGKNTDGEAETDYIFWALNNINSMANLSKKVFKTSVVNEYTLKDESLIKYSVIFLCNVGILDNKTISKLENFVQNGGSIVFTLGDNVDPSLYNRKLYREGTGILPGELGKRRGKSNDSEDFKNPVINDEHSIFRLIKSETYKPLINDIRVWGWFDVFISSNSLEKTNKSKILMSLNNNSKSPFLVEKRIGRGVSILLTTTVDDAWTNLPEKPFGFILFNELAGFLSKERGFSRNLKMGVPLYRILDQEEYGVDIRLDVPGKRQVRLEPPKETKNKRYYVKYDDTSSVGLYKLTVSAKKGKQILEEYFAVNMDPNEGIIKKADSRLIESKIPVHYIKNKKFSLIGSIKDKSKKKTNQQGLREAYLPIFFFLLLLVIAESFFAMYFGSEKKK